LTQPPPAPPVEPSKPSSERPANVQQIAVLVKQQQQTTVVLTDVTAQLEAMAARIEILETYEVPDHSDELSALSERVRAIEESPQPEPIDHSEEINALRDSIAEAVSRKMTFQMLDHNGQVKQEYKAGLGETVPFQLIPVDQGNQNDGRTDTVRDPDTGTRSD
jgi:hypothetical protein